jgi:ferredoxin
MPGSRASLEKEVCHREERTFAYTLTAEWSDDIWEYLKPFGQFRKTYDDGHVLRGTISDRGSRQPVAQIKVTRPARLVRFHFDERKNLRLLVQRIERQLTKFQSCVLCGSCAASCPSGALVVNGRFMVDEYKCTGCLGCVRSACLAAESLKEKGSSSWRICDGSL